MKKSLTQICLILLLAFVHSIVFAASDPITIARKTNIGSVEYWFTESAEKSAKKDGSNIDRALRQMPFQLITSLAKAGRETKGFQAYVRSRINFRKSASFELMGVVIKSELYILAEDKSKDVIKNFNAVLARNGISVKGNIVSVK